MTFDLLIQNGIICDGTGRPSYGADLGVVGEKIAAIGDLSGSSAARVIDAAGALVTPGFIDMHSHGDCTLLLFPGAETNLRQGVTTIVGGNCGTSPAPLDRVYLMQCWELDFWRELDPYTFYENSILDLEPVRRYFRDRLHYEMNWHSFGEYLDQVEKTGTAVNLVPLVGHGQVRAQVLGKDSSRPAHPEEKEAIYAGIREAMEAGAHGVSTGLDYAPGAFADEEELIGTAAAAGRYRGFYATHWRRTGIRKGNQARRGKIDGIREAIDIAKKADVPLEISHILNGFDLFPDTSALLQKAAAQATLEPIDRALSEGQPVSFDVVPNTSGGIDILPWLVRYFNPWFLQAGGLMPFIRLLDAGDYRSYIRTSVERGDWYLLNAQAQPDLNARLIVLRSANPDRIGKSAREIGAELGTDFLDTLFALLKEDPTVLVKQEMFHPDSVRTFLSHPNALVGSDSFTMDRTGIYGLTDPPYIMPHPNTYSAFPTFLTRFAEGSWEARIEQLTGRPASWLGLSDRGTLAEGNYADLLIMQPEALDPCEDYGEPRQTPAGISHVFVNGTMVVGPGCHGDARPGKVLRRR